MSDRFNQTGIAVVGVGRWGIHLVRNFLAHPQARLLAVVDRNPERLATVKQQFELNGDVVLATDWAQVRQLAQLEAVAIATPASTHYPLIEEAIACGYHVLAEKPLTLDPAESLKLCQLADKQQRQLVVDHTYLFHPAVLAGKKVIQSGRLGDLRYGYAQRTHLGPIRQDADVLWDLGAHDICIFNHWIGQMPIQVQATGTVLRRQLCEGRSGKPEVRSEKGESRPELGDTLPSPFCQELCDLVVLTLTYASGFQAFIHLCWCNPDKQRRLSIVGSQGTLIFDEMLPDSPLILQHGYLEDSDRLFTPAEIAREAIVTEPVEPLARVCDRFLDCAVRGVRSPVSSGWVGLEIVRILAACTQSMKQGGQPVTILDFRF